MAEFVYAAIVRISLNVYVKEHTTKSTHKRSHRQPPHKHNIIIDASTAQSIDNIIADSSLDILLKHSLDRDQQIYERVVIIRVGGKSMITVFFLVVCIFCG